jgi:hypothetical protein
MSAFTDAYSIGSYVRKKSLRLASHYSFVVSSIQSLCSQPNFMVGACVIIRLTGVHELTKK